MKKENIGKIDFPSNYEWMLSKMNNEYLGHSSKKKEKQIYDFDIWDEKDPAKSVVRYRARTANAMANKIKVLVKKLNK